MNLAFPFHFDMSGHTAATDAPSHILDMIEQILFTSPGERVNRPGFGSGTAQLVFAPNSDVLATAQQNVIQASLQMWLAVVYVVLQTQEQQTGHFVYGAAGAGAGT